MSTPSKYRRAAVAALTLPLLTGGLIVATTQAAHAACSHPAWQNYSPGAGRVTSTSPIRTGPSSDCGVVTNVGTAKDLFYHCWVENEAGNKWTHVRIANTNTMGWMYNGNLNDGGSVHPDNHCRA
ncbi:hypothetical protein GCM10009789_81280 [Kribbella sancticallisti]|uniref:SH3 domain-containing protein n=1 Tax=Kribbella sancticallisti TaxID=460087 RepID=A0ABN2ESC4_9ACTN